LPASTSVERRLRAQSAAYASWANTVDRSARARGGDSATRRRANLRTFERLIDPNGTMDPAERELRARHLQKAHMLRLSLLSLKARRARKEQAA
jgi:hypothetical protein